jgi:ribonuclease P/MRP protein subunit POP1
MAGVGPQVVQVLDFATARALELQALHESAHHKSLGSAETDAKLASQRNQRRRRANAFKSHSMPRRLRLPPTPTDATDAEEHISLSARHGAGVSVAAVTAMGSAAKARAKRDQKPRCRKHRRRMHLLLDSHSWLKQPQGSSHASGDGAEAGEEDSPQTAAKWLPTHAWHAKRMRMCERFGHVLAQRRQDKSVSAALTALRNTATLHDASYYGLLELYGLDTVILEVLSLVTDPSGSDVDDAGLFTGDREGRAVLHHMNRFPSGTIAPVSFMWRPINGADEEGADQEPRPRKRQLWLWIHAAAFMEAASAIASACHEVMSDRDDTEQIEILDRRGHVARFQLRGKGANAMLGKVLNSIGPREPETEDDEPSDREDGFPQSQVRIATATTNLLKLRADLSDAKHNNELDSFSVRVRDPRVRSPSSQDLDASRFPEASLLQEPTTAQLDAASAILCPLSGLSLTSGDAEEPDSGLILSQLEALLQWTTSAKGSACTGYPFVSPALSLPPASDADFTMAETEPLPTQSAMPCSELWSLSGRERVQRLFLKDHELNLIQVRGGDHDETYRRQATGVPLILVRQPGTFKSSGGWDLILSPVYAPAFLNAFVFAGAMVIGLDELEALATVDHAPSFPRDFPDTAAGGAYWNELRDALESEHVKKPKAKRIAYNKLGVESPFQPNWELLFGETSTGGEPDIPGDEDEEMEPSSSLCVLRSTSYMEPFPFSCGGEAKENADNVPMELIPVAVPTLIRVALSFPRRGALEPCSMVMSLSPQLLGLILLMAALVACIVAVCSDRGRSNELPCGRQMDWPSMGRLRGKLAHCSPASLQ